MPHDVASLVARDWPMERRGVLQCQQLLELPLFTHIRIRTHNLSELVQRLPSEVRPLRRMSLLRRINDSPLCPARLTEDTDKARAGYLGGQP